MVNTMAHDLIVYSSTKQLHIYFVCGIIATQDIPEEDIMTLTEILFIIRIALSGIMLVCAGIVIALVIMQSSNSDGTQAMTGASSDRDAYGNNASGRRERSLKVATYILAGIMAVISIAFIVIEAIVA